MDERLPGRGSPRLMAFALALAAFAFVLDQATKTLVLAAFDYGLYRPPVSFAPGPAVEVLPFANLVLVWNRGISFGLLPGGELFRWLFVLFSIGICGLLALWLRSMRQPWPAAAVGLILGGALGNALDRLVYGAVVDMIHLHAFGYDWYVFNIADCAIVLGVGIFLALMLFGRDGT